jgi:hypothetical protein
MRIKLKRMDQRIKDRMKKALDMKGLNYYRVSEAAGLNPEYLTDSFRPNRRTGSLTSYKRVCEVIGLSFIWLVEGDAAGEPYPGVTPPPLEREAILAALEALLGRFLRLDQAEARNAAEVVLGIAERPPGGSYAIGKLDRIRISVLTALSLYEPPCRS